MNNVLAAKNGLLGGLKIPKIAPESKNAIFSKSEIMVLRSNLSGEKEGQTNVSLDLKRFCDHYRGF